MGNSEIAYSALPDKTELVRYIVVFFIKNVANPRSYSFTKIATNGITTGQLFLLCWQAVAILEITCRLKVVACTADGASPNRNFVRIHKVIIFIWLPLKFGVA